MIDEDVLNGVEASRRAGWAHYYAALDTIAKLTGALMFTSELAKAGDGHWSNARERISYMLDSDIEAAVAEHRADMTKRYPLDRCRAEEREMALGWGPHAFSPVQGSGSSRGCNRCGRSRVDCETNYLQ